MTVASRFFGLVNRRERWSLSLRGWIFLFGTFLLVGLGAVLGVHPFLAHHAPVKADVLVVEGWIPEAAIKLAAAEVLRGNYKTVYSVGGAAGGMADSEKVSIEDTYASIAADKLKRAGVPESSIKMVPTRVQARDRTLGAATELRRWLEERQIQHGSFNVATLGVHARRTHCLFRRAFGPGTAIGVIAIPNQGYEARRWWNYSEGVKQVITESIAYVYAKIAV